MSDSSRFFSGVFRGAGDGRKIIFAVAVLVLLALAVMARPAQAAPGDLDLTFSGDGKVVTAIRDWSSAEDVAVQDDGKVVAAGFSDSDVSSENFDFAVARYNADGSPDTTFSGDGLLSTDFANGDDEIFDLIVKDGKILAAGYSINGESGFGFALARYNSSNGSLDTTFDADGRVTTSFGGEAGFNEIRGLALQPDGRIVATGYLGDFDANGDFFSDFAVARYNANGSPDTGFSGDGRLTTDLGGRDEAEAVAVQSDGKLVVAGNGGRNEDANLVRYAADGSLDTGFGGGDGVVNSAFYYALDLELQPDGKIIGVGGGGSQGTSADGTFAVARYNANGSPDTTFSGDGRQFTGFGNFTLSGANAATLQPDGKLVVAGSSDATTGGNFHFALARYQVGAGPDETPPVVRNVSPTGKTTDRTPTIKATVTDAVTDLAKEDIALEFDGVRVPAESFSYSVKDVLTYNPPKLLRGAHTVRVTATDDAGNTGVKGWSFKIVRR